MQRAALVSRSLVPRSLPVLGLALISLKPNGHDPAGSHAPTLLDIFTCRADIALRSWHRLDGCLYLGLGLRSLRWSPRVAGRTCPVGPLKVVRWPRPPPRGPCAVPHLIVIWCRFEKQSHHTSLSRPLTASLPLVLSVRSTRRQRTGVSALNAEHQRFCSFSCSTATPPQHSLRFA